MSTPPTPRFRSLSIGDELLFGKTLDTNAHYLAGQASRLGLQVVGAEIVGDDQDLIETAIIRAGTDTDLLIVTGGLGPTEDDRTRHALAAVLNQPLHENEAAWRLIETYFKRHLHDVPISTANRRQCLLPAGCQALANDRGTAPGILAHHQGCWIACLPGVPHEMRAMAGSVLGSIGQLLPSFQPPHVDEIHLAGIGESTVQERLDVLLCSHPHLTVGITAQDDGHLCIRCLGGQSAVSERLQAIAAVLPEFLLPAGCTSVAEAVVRRCIEGGYTLTAAESCTCGNVLAALGAVPGVSACLRDGLVTYHNDSKVANLGVSETLITEHGVVSQPVVEAMARGAQRRTGANLALATSGIAGPDGGSDEKPVGLVHYAAALGPKLITRHRVWPGTRQRIQHRAASAVLLLAWELLRGN